MIAFVALGVSRVQGMSQAISHPPAAGSIPATVVQINPKTITYEVFGSLGSGGRVVYADLDGAPIEVALTSLPWSHSETTTSPSASLSLVTQVDGDSVGCRIRVDGRVRDERSVAHHAAAAACTQNSTIGMASLRSSRAERGRRAGSSAGASASDSSALMPQSRCRPPRQHGGRPTARRAPGRRRGCGF
ncbi:hypothetical protein A5694_12215, partial [Mycolicibacter sinensis]